MPYNVRVFSLGKEQLRKRSDLVRKRSDLGNFGLRSVLVEQFQKVKYIINFYRLIWRERKNYDTVFVHMNPIYVVFGGLLWRIWDKKIGLWYAHKQVDLKLRIAEKFANIIFTVARGSFVLQTRKLNIVGHGIPFDFFKKRAPSVIHEKFRIISVGRISPIKNLETLIEAVNILRDKNIAIDTLIVGGPAHKGDEEYLEKLKNKVSEKKDEDSVMFTGSIPNNKIREYYWKSDLSINLCPTGGVDKAVLESIASGLLVLVSNEAFSEYFGKYSELLLFKERDVTGLARKIMEITSRGDKKEMKKYIYERTIERANIDCLILRILRIYEAS